MRNLPWPEMESQEAPGKTIRELLDYLCWINREMRQLGYHSGSDRETWCRSVHRAYTALFVPMVSGHGDPYPPDVPPARNPGIWPDIPSASIPGMTLRHQLTVMEMLATQLRNRRWIHARAQEVAGWDRRLKAAYDALQHGNSPTMPADARTEASPEALEEAAAADRALRDRARRRGQQLRKQFTDSREKEAASQKARARKQAEPEQAAVPSEKTAKKATAKRKTTTKKAATKKKKKKTTKKTTTKKVAKKKTARKG